MGGSTQLPEPTITNAAREFVRRVGKRYNVRGALLFGSRVRGTHQPGSDVDVAILLRGPRGRFLSEIRLVADYSDEEVTPEDASWVLKQSGIFVDAIHKLIKDGA